MFGLRRDKLDLLQIFSAAADVLRRIGEDMRIIQEFIDLGAKAKVAASEAMDAEAALGDIPDEFLDPIQVRTFFFSKSNQVSYNSCYIDSFRSHIFDLDEWSLFDLQYTLMKDPVILPSSRITVDRPVIQRHLLSDSVSHYVYVSKSFIPLGRKLWFFTCFYWFTVGPV